MFDPAELSLKAKDGERCGVQRETVPLTVPQKSVFRYVRQLWDSIRMSVYIIGTALVVFVAARNSVTWHLQRIWGASGSYWQSKWDSIYDIFNGNDMALAMWGLIIVSCGSFWVFNSFLLIVDVTEWPKFLLRYKIQPTANVPINRKKLRSALFWVFFNLTIVGLPLMYVAFMLMKWRGCSFGRELPTFHWVVFELVIFSLVEEVFFYYSHRLPTASVDFSTIHSSTGTSTRCTTSGRRRSE